jgi:hypothetical protein
MPSCSTGLYVSELLLSALDKVHSHRTPVAYSDFLAFPLYSVCSSREASEKLYVYVDTLIAKSICKHDRLVVSL